MRDGRSELSREFLPRIGESVSLDSIKKAFQINSLDGPDNWLLVVTSSCPFCLSLDAELDQLKRAAACDGAHLLPLVIGLGAPVDSINAILAAHGLRSSGVSGPEGLAALSVYSVPSVLKLDAGGVIRDVFSPGIAGSWPPRPSC